MSAAKPGCDLRSDRDPEVVCELDLRTGELNRLRTGSRRRSRTLAAPPTRAMNDPPCRLVDHLEGRNSVQPPSHSADQRPSAQSSAVGTALALIKLGNDWLAKNSWEQQTLCCAIV